EKNHTSCLKQGMCYAPSLAQPRRSAAGLGGAALFPADVAPGAMSFKERFVEVIKSLSVCDHNIEQSIRQGICQPVDDLIRKVKSHSRTKKSEAEIAGLVRAVLDKGWKDALEKQQGLPVLNMFTSWYEKTTTGEKISAVGQLGLGMAF